MIENLSIAAHAFVIRVSMSFSVDAILFTQPLHSGRIWHKVNFKAEFNRF